MGFKYGIWLIYDNDEMSRDHIPHIIVANFLEKNNKILKETSNKIISDIKNNT